MVSVATGYGQSAAITIRLGHARPGCRPERAWSKKKGGGAVPRADGQLSDPRVAAAGADPGRRLGGLADDLAVASLALARRLAAGATLWCWSPAWPHHAHHVAVEFVHPVIVGKRALPAAAVPDSDPVGALRSLAVGGDVVLAIAAADDPVVRTAMQRAPAWGVVTVWIGFGPRPPAGAADHVLWLDEAGAAVGYRGGDAAAQRGHDEPAYTGDIVLLYHLLWELTHVCFEHPGLLAEPAGSCDGEVCITCSDEGRVGEVVDPGRPDVATVRTAAGDEEVDVTLVGPVQFGDLLLIHAGMALDRLIEP
jgi:hydrogenase maturation factor